MSVSEWVPFNESRFVGAYVVDGTLTGWFRNPGWPVAETPLSQWLMDEVGYEKPAPPQPGIPRPAYGQGWPIWSASPTQVGAGELQVVRMTQAEYAALPVKDKFTMYILEG